MNIETRLDTWEDGSPMTHSAVPIKAKLVAGTRKHRKQTKSYTIRIVGYEGTFNLPFNQVVYIPEGRKKFLKDKLNYHELQVTEWWCKENKVKGEDDNSQ